jgi:hypothetical protein
MRVTDRYRLPGIEGTGETGDDHRNIFILFALAFALVTTAAATVVTTAMTSDAAFALATR